MEVLFLDYECSSFKFMLSSRLLFHAYGLDAYRTDTEIARYGFKSVFGKSGVYLSCDDILYSHIVVLDTDLLVTVCTDGGLVDYDAAGGFCCVYGVLRLFGKRGYTVASIDVSDVLTVMIRPCGGA